MNIALYLERISQIAPEKDALFSGRESLATYGEFARHTRQAASWLRAQGIVEGDRVAIFMKNDPDYLVLQYAIWYLGAVAVPINAKLHAKEVAWIIENSGTKLTFVSDAFYDELSSVVTSSRCIPVSGFGFAADFQDDDPGCVPRSGDDLAWLFYTSGTTGRPKGVMITHRMLRTMALCYFTDADQVSSQDTALYAAPMSHGAGIYNIMHVMMGAKHVFPLSGGFDEAEIFDLAKHHRSVHMFAAPTMVKRLTEVAKTTSEMGEGLRTIVYAGGPMYVTDIIEAVDHFGDIFVQIYGQGECPMAITALSRHDVSDRHHPRWRERLASVGRAQSAVEVKIGDAEGRELPIGEIGEIMVRGDAVMPGYWNNPEATAQTLIEEWLMTGDMGSIDEEGYVTMHDRSKDMIISGGSNIYPREVEEVLLQHSSLREVAVIGAPNEEWGEIVVAFVVMQDGADLNIEALDAHCLRLIARFKRPKSYRVIEALPKNNYGKILKTKLREMA